MAFHVMRWDEAAGSTGTLVACFFSIEAAECYRFSKQNGAAPGEHYYVQCTTVCTCNQK